jgi:hypothetical protein
MPVICIRCLESACPTVDRSHTTAIQIYKLCEEHEAELLSQIADTLRPRVRSFTV